MDYYILSPITFVLRVIEALAQLTLVITISNVKIKLDKILFSSLLLAILFEIAKVSIPQYLTAFVSTMFAISIIIFILKINYKKAIPFYLLTVTTVAIIDCIVCIVLVKICNLSSFEELASSKLLIGIAKVAIIVILFIISKILNSYFNKDLYKIKPIKTNTIIINSTITFFLLIPNLIMILYYHDNKTLPLSVIIVNIIAIVATFLVNIINTERNIKFVRTEEELLTEKIYNRTLNQLVDSLRIFKHDYDNTLITIDGYIFTEDWAGLKSFVKDVVKETKEITALNRLNPELFKNPSIYGLVTAKFEYARKSDVTMNFEIYADLDNIEIKSYDFTRILGIFLDNAIEAAIGSEKKVVNFYVIEKDNKVIIDISNTFSDMGLRVEDMRKKGFSSKGKDRGLGLYKVNDILSRYHKVRHETSVSNNMFLQRLVIEKIISYS